MILNRVLLGVALLLVLPTVAAAGNGAGPRCSVAEGCVPDPLFILGNECVGLPPPLDPTQGPPPCALPDDGEPCIEEAEQRNGQARGHHKDCVDLVP